MTSQECVPASAHAIDDEVAVTIAAMLKAISDPLRLRMLSAIASDPRGEACVCDLTGLGDVSQPTVSHHLRVMKESGLLISERRGTWVYYRIAPLRRRAVTALFDEFAHAVLMEASTAGEKRLEAPEALASEVEALAHKLAEELNYLNRDLVFVIVRESYAALVRSAERGPQLIAHTERFARQRLADLTRERDHVAPQILFVCVANAGRSQLAAAIMNRLSEGKVVARSAGSAPAAEVQTHVVPLLLEIAGSQGATDAFPKPLTDDAVRAADVVITMGCGDVCPIIPGVRYEDWAVGDPALASATGVAAIRDDIEARVQQLLESLDILATH